MNMALQMGFLSQSAVNKAEETKMTKKEYEKSKTAATENSDVNFCAKENYSVF